MKTKTVVLERIDMHFNMPTDFVHYSGSEYDSIINSKIPGEQPSIETINIEKVTHVEKNSRLNNSIIPPTLENPILCIEGEGFMVLPKEIKEIRLTYTTF